MIDSLSSLNTSGNYIRIPRVLPKVKYERLIKLADNYLTNPTSRPIYISNVKELGSTPLERYKASGVHVLLEAAQPWLEKQIGREWLVLSGKVLLRRTWPIKEAKARALGHNASNLTWHQDSNSKHGNRPMIVLMTALQDGAGSKRPGLSILEAPVDKFEGIYGYQGKKIEELERSIGVKYGEIRTVTPILNSGELLIFNGLTFHRTFSNETMESHRDALLVRIIKPEDRGNFPEGPHLMISTKSK